MCDDHMELENYEAVTLPLVEETGKPVTRPQLIDWFQGQDGGAKYVGRESMLKTGKGCSTFILFINMGRIVTYFMTRSGSYEIQDDVHLIRNIYTNSSKWFVNLNAIPRTYETFQS